MRQKNYEHLNTTYPRPRLKRNQWFELNGSWDFSIHKEAEKPTYSETIQVPFSPETEYSGIQRAIAFDDILYYRRVFTLPENQRNGKIILHLGAVDQVCSIRLNGILLTYHEGGYWPIRLDITQHIRRNGQNELLVTVADLTESSHHSRGLQSLANQSEIGPNQKPTSGIWQSVWIENIPHLYVKDVKFEADPKTGEVRTYITSNQQFPMTARLIVRQQGEVVLKKRIDTDSWQNIFIEEPKLWSPIDPHLYDVKIEYGDDELSTYFAFRTLKIHEDYRGYQRVYLNDQAFFLNGVLYEGYWPDTGLTAPDSKQLLDDLVMIKNMGFNTVRVHMKVEEALFYYYCDHIGLAVWQDIPAGDEDPAKWLTETLPKYLPASRYWFPDSVNLFMQRKTLESKQQYQKDLERTLEHLAHYPSIVVWNLFHEGRGQYHAKEATRVVRQYDSTRLISETSGTFFQGSGDFESIHARQASFRLHRKSPLCHALSSYGPLKGETLVDRIDDLERYVEEGILPHIYKGLSVSLLNSYVQKMPYADGLMSPNRRTLRVPQAVVKRLNEKIYTLFAELT